VKGKKSLFLLLPLVAVIWGLIIYRLVDFTKTKPLINTNRNVAVLAADSILYPKQQKLLLNYSDPFLRNMAKNSEAKNSNGAISLFKTNPEPEKKIVVWPTISYGGIIENKSTQFAIIKIDEKKVVTSQSQSVSGMVIKYIYKDSIIIEKEKELKTFFK
jgi:hypothetical protein